MKLIRCIASSNKCLTSSNKKLLELKLVAYCFYLIKDRLLGVDPHHSSRTPLAPAWTWHLHVGLPRSRKPSAGHQGRANKRCSQSTHQDTLLLVLSIDFECLYFLQQPPMATLRSKSHALRARSAIEKGAISIGKLVSTLFFHQTYITEPELLF